MDILLDPETHDCVFINGTCPITENKAHAVQQRLKVTLLTFLGEWFLDTSIGVPYFQQIFGKSSSKDGVDLIFQQKLMEDPDVVEILEFSSTLDSAARTYIVRFRVKTVDGTPTDTVTLTFGA